jgi:two-component system LytT family response regulator
MNELTAVIIEDEGISRDILRNYLGSYCTNVNVIGEASNIEDGEKLIRLHNPSIVFLDIEMPYGNGFDLLENIDNINFEVIFITAFSDYAIKAINLSASSYLLKPIDIDELINAIEKVKSNILNQLEAFSTKVLAENIKTLNNKDQKIVLPQMDGFEVVKICNIIRAEASDNYTILYIDNGKKYTLSKTLKYYENLLTEYGFLRTHKSHLLNLNHIVKYKKGKVGEAIMSDGSNVLVASSSKKELMMHFS